MEEFYFVVSTSREKKTVQRFGRVNVMINIASRTISIPEKRKKLFVDSGGFSFFTKFTEYPYTPKEYIEKAPGLNPDFFANMDVPCEPEIIKRRNSTIKEHIELTLSNQHKILDILEDDVKKFIPVIQGWNVSDYLYCIDRMKEEGLISDYMALGSVCRRHKEKKIKKILLSVKRELPKTRLHGFGVKIGILKDFGCFNSLYSCDSAAWHFEDMFTKAKNKKYGYVEDNLERQYLVGSNWKNKLDNIINSWQYQQKL